jgi:hypothetical protein
MRGWKWLLAAALLLTGLLAGFGSATVEAAGSGNRTNDRLLSLPPARQAQALGNSLRRGCVGVSAFLMGVTARGRAKGDAYWSIRCKNGRSYVVQIAPDAKGTAVVADCRALRGTGRECFRKF